MTDPAQAFLNYGNVDQWSTAEINEVIRARNETGQYLAAVIADNGGSISLPSDFDYRPDRTVTFGTYIDLYQLGAGQVTVAAATAGAKAADVARAIVRPLETLTGGSTSTATRNALLSVRAELDKLIEG